MIPLAWPHGVASGPFRPLPAGRLVYEAVAAPCFQKLVEQYATVTVQQRDRHSPGK